MQSSVPYILSRVFVMRGARKEPWSFPPIVWGSLLSALRLGEPDAGESSSMANEQYRRLAAERLQLAKQATNPEHKVAHLDMANVWLRLALEVETKSSADLAGHNKT